MPLASPFFCTRYICMIPVRSVYAVFIYSLVSWLITDVLPVDVSIASPLARQDLLLCAIFGGLISGIGSGLTIRSGGAIDGITILSARGYYSDEKKKMLYFVVNRFQISKVRDIVREFDKTAYVTITDVADVL